MNSRGFPLLVSSLVRPALGEPRPPPDEKRARGDHGDDDERFRRDLALPDAANRETERNAGGPPLRRRRRRGAHLRSLREHGVGEGREWREKGARDGTDDFARRRAEEGRFPSARVGGRSDAPSRLPRTCPRPVRRRTTRRGTAEPWRTRLRRTHPRRGFLDRWRRRRGWRRRPRRRVSRRALPDPRRVHLGDALEGVRGALFDGDDLDAGGAGGVGVGSRAERGGARGRGGRVAALEPALLGGGRVRPRPPREGTSPFDARGTNAGALRTGDAGEEEDGDVSRASASGARDAMERGGDGGAATRGRSSRPRDEVGGGGWDGRRVGRAGGHGDAPDAAVGRTASRGAGGRAGRADADGTGERDREGHGARRVAVRGRVPGGDRRG